LDIKYRQFVEGIQVESGRKKSLREMLIHQVLLVLSVTKPENVTEFVDEDFLHKRVMRVHCSLRRQVNLNSEIRVGACSATCKFNPFSVEEGNRDHAYARLIL